MALSVGSTFRSLAVVAGSSAVLYGFLIVMMRLLARRQLGQLTAIDLAVVLVLGSAVETSMIHGDTSLPAGLTSAATLLVMNAALTALFLRSRRWRHLVGGGPIILVHDGQPIEEHLRRAGFTADDLAEALRSRGYDNAAQLKEAVLETDGSVSAVPMKPA